MMDIRDFDELMLFAKFKEKPGLYFGRPSLLSLRDQLFGMRMAFGMIYHEDAFVYLHQFIRWYHENVIKDRNGYACWWNHILYTCAGDDKMAFWEFFKCFEEYLKNIHGLELPMPQEGQPVKQKESVDGSKGERDMNEINTADLLDVYASLKDKYNLTLTNTVELNDGFTIDCPIIVGKAHGRILYLYEYYGEFVLDVMDESKTKGTHWHPWDVAAAIEDVVSFMEGKEDDQLKEYGQSS